MNKLTRFVVALGIIAAGVLTISAAATATPSSYDQAWTPAMNQTSYWAPWDCTKYNNHGGWIPAEYDAAVIKAGQKVRVYPDLTTTGGFQASAPDGKDISWVMKCKFPPPPSTTVPPTSQPPPTAPPTTRPDPTTTTQPPSTTIQETTTTTVAPTTTQSPTTTLLPTTTVQPTTTTTTTVAPTTTVVTTTTVQPTTTTEAPCPHNPDLLAGDPECEPPATTSSTTTPDTTATTTPPTTSASSSTTTTTAPTGDSTTTTVVTTTTQPCPAGTNLHADGNCHLPSTGSSLTERISLAAALLLLAGAAAVLAPILARRKT